MRKEVKKKKQSWYLYARFDSQIDIKMPELKFVSIL